MNLHAGITTLVADSNVTVAWPTRPPFDPPRQSADSDFDPCRSGCGRNSMPLTAGAIVAWDVSDTLSVVATIVSLTALAMALWQWRTDRSDRAAERYEDRIWTNVVDLLIARDGGLRTVAALDDTDADGKLQARLTALRRTTIQLKTVGEEDLASRLAQLVEQWEHKRPATPTNPNEQARLDFYDAVKNRLELADRRAHQSNRSAHPPPDAQEPHTPTV
jgi:hypothetical protein